MSDIQDNTEFGRAIHNYPACNTNLEINMYIHIDSVQHRYYKN
jgi:hypothetical protein